MKKPKSNITGRFATSKPKLSEYFATNLILFRWQLWTRYCAWFFAGVVVASLIISLIGWRVYTAMSVTTLSGGEMQSASVGELQPIQSAEMANPIFPTPTPRPTLTATPAATIEPQPLQALEMAMPVMTPTPEPSPIVSGLWLFDIYSLDETGQMAGRLNVSEKENYACICTETD